MKVLHIVGRKLEEINPKADNTFEFLDGDVYVIDNGNDIFIWRGKDCGVDEQTVGAWIANKLDNTDRGGEPSVFSIVQGEETDKLKELINIDVLDGDTPGFLKNAELDMVDYKLYRVFTKKETAEMDETFVEEVKIDKKSLISDDVYVLDGNENIYLWIGKNANREEKYSGQKLMQSIDTERNYLPLQYTIYEGEGGKCENAFYKFISVAAKSGPVVSVEDQRELSYKPEQSMTAKEHKSKAKDIDRREEQKTSIAKATKKEKKSFWSKLKFW